MSEPAPTVIVSRRVRPGRERSFARWNERLRATAERQPGYLGSEVQPPDEAHPGEWVTVYRFASHAQLDEWLSSPERNTLLSDGTALLDGPVREQRLVEPAGSQPVTAVATQRVRRGAEEDFRRVHADMLRAMGDRPGFLRADLLEPVAGVQEDHAIVFSFASRPDLDRWLESEERAALLPRLSELIEGGRTTNVVGGFAGWFPATGHDQRPPRWKQALAVLLALFPTTLTLGSLQRALLPDVPWVPALLASNVLGIALLTWVLMPLVTRLLAGWLHRR